MKKLLLICFLLFSMAGGAYYWFIAHPGYAPKVNSYGNLYNRLIADSAQHIPNKSCLCTNDNDTTPQLFVYMDTVRGFWNGNFHNIGFGSGGGSGVDTIYVTQIGTGSPQIPLVYAVNGSLRVARLVPGVFTTPFMNADSAAGINIDTTGSAGIAYKLWIIAQYGPAGAGLDGTLAIGDSAFQKAMVLSWAPRSATYTRRAFFEVSPDSLTGFFQVGDVNGNGTVLGVSMTQRVAFIRADSGFQIAGGGNTQFSMIQTQAAQTGGGFVQRLKLPFTGNLVDTLATKADVRAGGGGGGGGFTRQPITSGSSGTVTGGNYIVTFDPASVIAAYNLTLPTSPSDQDIVKIEAGGTITGGNPVVTALTITGTKMEAVTVTTINAGEYIEYEYRTSNTKWYRHH